MYLCTHIIFYTVYSHNFYVFERLFSLSNPSSSELSDSKHQHLNIHLSYLDRLCHLTCGGIYKTRDAFATFRSIIVPPVCRLCDPDTHGARTMNDRGYGRHSYIILFDYAYATGTRSQWCNRSAAFTNSKSMRTHGEEQWYLFCMMGDKSPLPTPPPVRCHRRRKCQIQLQLKPGMICTNKTIALCRCCKCVLVFRYQSIRNGLWIRMNRIFSLSCSTFHTLTPKTRNAFDGRRRRSRRVYYNNVEQQHCQKIQLKL